MAGSVNGLLAGLDESGKAMEGAERRGRTDPKDGSGAAGAAEAPAAREESGQTIISESEPFRTASEGPREVGKNAAVPSVGTQVASDGSVRSRYLRQSQAEKQAGQAAAQACGELEWVESCVRPEEIGELNEEGSPYEEYTSDCLERAIRRVKEQRRFREESLDRQVEKNKETREQVRDSGLSDQEKQMADRLEASGMPVTKENLEKLSGALQMAETALQRLNESGVGYLMKNGLESSISNLYKASYLNAGNGTGGQSGYPNTSVTKDTGVHEAGGFGPGGSGETDAAWESVQVQAEALLTQEGIPVTEETLQEARWLFEQELTIDAGNMAELESLKALTQAKAPAEDSVDRMIGSLDKGQDPADTVLGDARSREAAYAVEKWSRLEPDEFSQISTRRQVEEIRLKMTAEAAVRLLEKGIRLDTDNLNQIVEGLKELEDQWYRKLLSEAGVGTESGVEDASGSGPEAALLKEVLEKREESLGFSGLALNGVYRSGGSITFREYYEEGSAFTARMKEAGEAYEASATEIRRDLGDSIRKAFTGLDEFLNRIGLEETEANERAVRILSYNNLEATPESVERMKYYDAQVREMLSEMKPAVVARMIRDGTNPLELSMKDLGAEVRQLSEELQPEEESYGRFLWKLERQEDLPAEERSAYIGIYRLLHQIERSDGAAIGAVVEAGQELTLKNLLTAVRTEKGGGLDRKVDDATGELTGAAQPENSITDQIGAAFARQEAGRVKRDLSRPEDGYLQWKTEQLKAQITDPSEAVRLLKEYELPCTPEQVAAAKELLAEGKGGRKPERLSGFLESLKSGEKETIRALGEDALDALGDPEELRESIAELTEEIRGLLNREKGSDTLTADRLQELRMLGSVMALTQSLAGQEHYEIPLLSEDGAVSHIRLTVRHEGSRAGHLEIRMMLDSSKTDEEQPVETGGSVQEEIRGEFEVRQGRLGGYLECGSRQIMEELERKLEAVRTALSENGLKPGGIVCVLRGAGNAGRGETPVMLRQAYGADAVQKPGILSAAVPEGTGGTASAAGTGAASETAVGTESDAEAGGTAGTGNTVESGNTPEPGSMRRSGNTPGIRELYQAAKILIDGIRQSGAA